MKVGILSDTHKNRELHEKALRCLTDACKVDRIYHLGDDYKDGELEMEKGIEIIQVPGIYCSEYRDEAFENRIIDTVQGLSIIMVHDIKELSDNDILCNDIILHGHTHLSELRLDRGKLFINPGHLKGPMNKGKAPSFATIEIDFGEITATLFDIEGEEFNSMTLKKGQAGLNKV